MKDLNCLRCGGSMSFLGTEQLQLGKTGWLLGRSGEINLPVAD